MTSSSLRVRKPKALRKGSTVAYFAPASPPSEGNSLDTGLHELHRLGFHVVPAHQLLPSGYFAAPAEDRAKGFLEALRNEAVDGLIALRGGFGSTYLLDSLAAGDLGTAKCIIGYSDLTAIHTFLWQRHSWVTFQGPMLISGFDRSTKELLGYDQPSFLNAVTNTKGNWRISLNGESLIKGQAEGEVLGGCLTILQTSLGTPWELHTDGAILLLEDTLMKPYQVDRALMHLRQAGKLKYIKGLILGEFPGCEPTVAGGPTVRNVCERILAPLGVPIIFGAPVGHTPRPILTIPLGIHARLDATGGGSLEFSEPAVID